MCWEKSCALIMAPQEVKFMENRLGGVALVIDGCKYRINRRSGTTVYWRCFFRWCRANAVVEDGKLKSSCGKHICQQPLNNGGGANATKTPLTGRHHQLQRQQTPAAVSSQQTAIQQRRPVALATDAAAATVKMATRAAQGSATQTLTRNANKAKTALRSQKPSTNNNMVVRRKSKATEEDNKTTVVQHLQPSPAESPQPICASEPSSSPKQVTVFMIIILFALCVNC